MTRPRRRAGRTAAVRWPGLLAVLVLAGCGVAPQQAPEPVPPDRLPSATASPHGGRASTQVRVWGARESRLVPVFVEVSGTGTGPAGRVAALLALTEVGADQQPPTVIRRGTRLLRLEQSGDTVEATFNDELHLVPTTDLPLALGQIVFTVTEQRGVERVLVRAGDRAVRYVDATGQTISRPLVRGDFEGLA